ncbi:MAG: molybdopterin-dependent oxidoreductase FAD-binding subunit [Anaerolineales bacterium]
MITTYHRPQTLDEALTLLSQPNTVPLGGGTLLSHGTVDPVSVVDLQALGLDYIRKKGNPAAGSGQALEIGATVTLQQLLESEHCPEALKTALNLEAPLNLRNTATVAGTLAACDGHSTFVASLLALDAKLETIANRQSQIVNIGEFLPLRPRGLITQIVIPLNIKFAFEYVARTPSDKPIVCAALTQWNSGRARLALGGWGKAPTLAMDGTEAEGLEAAARNACHEAADEMASAEYRMDVAATLAKRCLEAIHSQSR